MRMLDINFDEIDEIKEPSPLNEYNFSITIKARKEELNDLLEFAIIHDESIDVQKVEIAVPEDLQKEQGTQNQDDQEQDVGIELDKIRTGRPRDDGGT